VNSKTRYPSEAGLGLLPDLTTGAVSYSNQIKMKAFVTNGKSTQRGEVEENMIDAVYLCGSVPARFKSRA
jgi:hypothetical protein